MRVTMSFFPDDSGNLNRSNPGNNRFGDTNLPGNQNFNPGNRNSPTDGPQRNQGNLERLENIPPRSQNTPERGQNTPPRRGRGFASMDPQKVSEIASMGGKAAHAQGVAHEWSTEEARAAGRKGGQASRGSRSRPQTQQQGSLQAGGGE